MLGSGRIVKRGIAVGGKLDVIDGKNVALCLSESIE
jgi:hypothetical protein